MTTQTTNRSSLSQDQVAKKYGWRSGLEERTGAAFSRLNLPFQFEEVKLEYIKPQKPSKYTPDFVLTKNLDGTDRRVPLIIETKGRFLALDRQKHLLIKAQHPELDVRFVFTNPNTFLTSQQTAKFRAWLKKNHKITVVNAEVRAKYKPLWLSTLKSKPSQTTYANWCDRHGYYYAKENVPRAWLQE